MALLDSLPGLYLTLPYINCLRVHHTLVVTVLLYYSMYDYIVSIIDTCTLYNNYACMEKKKQQTSADSVAYRDNTCSVSTCIRK